MYDLTRRWTEESWQKASMRPAESALIMHSQHPLNGGPPAETLCREFITPTQLFFIRNHGAVPEIDPASYRLVVGGRGAQPLQLTLLDLRARFPRVHLPAALQCAGNRRRELMAIAPIAGEIPWGGEAIGNAHWSGWRLRDVLQSTGVQNGTGHVAFAGLDVIEREGERFGFGGSIPLEKAMSPEVLLADEMNGAPLSPVHGFPLRVLVPGYIGARSVKWLSEIRVQPNPSENYYQAHAYKIFPPDVRANTVDWTRGLTLGELSVNAVICEPGDGSVLAGRAVRVGGYAITSGGRRIERIDLTRDSGRTWHQADLIGGQGPWTWTVFQASLDLEPGDHELCVRAWDSAGNTQSEDARTVWNFKGYVNNAWHRVRVRVT